MEIEILSMLQKIRTPLLDIFMSNITKLGNAGIVWILLTIVLLLIPKTKKKWVDSGISLNRRPDFMQRNIKTTNSKNPPI